MRYAELKCGECNEVIAFYSDDSGAPHYHIYYCAGCKNKLEEEDPDDWLDEYSVDD